MGARRQTARRRGETGIGRAADKDGGRGKSGKGEARETGIDKDRL